MCRGVRLKSSTLGGSNAVPGTSVRLMVRLWWGGEGQKPFKNSLFGEVKFFNILLIQSVALTFEYIMREESYKNDEVCVR